MIWSCLFQVVSIDLLCCGAVEEEAVNRLEELKEEYYETYTKLPDDNFCFFRGLHRAQAYAEKFVSEEVDERE